MDTGTGRIFIQRVGYGGATTRTLPTPLTSLLMCTNHFISLQENLSLTTDFTDKIFLVTIMINLNTNLYNKRLLVTKSHYYE